MQLLYQLDFGLITSSKGILCISKIFFILLNTSEDFSKSLQSTLTLATYESTYFPKPCHLNILNIFASQMAFSFNFLIIHEMEHIFRSLSALCIFSSENCLVISFAYLSNINVFCTLRVSNSCLMHGSATDGLVSSQRCVSRRLVRVLMSKGTLGITEACKPEQNSAHPISRDTSCPRNLIVLDINLQDVTEDLARK